MNKVQMEKLKTKHMDNTTIGFPYHVISKYTEEEEDMVKTLRENLNLGKHESDQVFFESMRVMLIRNSVLYDRDSDVEIKLVNGDTGIIVEFDYPPKPIESVFPSKSESALNALHVRYAGKLFKKTRFPVVRFDRFPDYTFQILPSSWKRQEINPSDGEMVIRIEVDAVPLIPSWAITSHRCQGATISNIPITINADCMEFCEGSFYVSFSRGREFEQISIINYKGYRQNKDAYGFYKGILKLEDPREYKMISNEEDLVLRFGEKKKSSQTSLSVNNKQESTINIEGDVNISEQPIISEQPKADIRTTWETVILPNVNTAFSDIEQFETMCNLMKQWMKTTRKKLKH
jgi:hypothetical protein